MMKTKVEGSKNRHNVYMDTQPKFKLDFTSKKHLNLINEAAALTDALPGTELVGSTVISVDK